MKELTTAVKTILLNPQIEDHHLIFSLQEKTIELDNRLEIIKLKLQSQEKIDIKSLKNSLNIALVNNGYEEINTNETLEIEDV